MQTATNPAGNSCGLSQETLQINGLADQKVGGGGVFFSVISVYTGEIFQEFNRSCDIVNDIYNLGSKTNFKVKHIVL